MKFDNIHIGSLINERVIECNIEGDRICKFFKCDETEIEIMYNEKSLQTETLLKWSKLLQYDFFRIYTQHIILYSPISSEIKIVKPQRLPEFRKNIYMKEMVDFILGLIDRGEKTKKQIIEEYKIPKTTLYKWLHKYYNTDESK